MSKYDPRPFTVTEIVGRQAVLERDGAKIKRETQKFKRFYPKPEQVQQNKNDDWEEGSERKTGEDSERSAKDHKEGQVQAATEAGSMMAGSASQPNTTNVARATETPARTDDIRQRATTDLTTATDAPRRTPRTHGPPDRYGSWVTK